MRAAKARKRMANPVEREPRMVRWNRFEIVVRDRLTGETGCFELRSLRDVGRRLSVMMKYYE
jgi:type II secretory pathway component PulK